MCRDCCGWDEAISNELRPLWEKWTVELPKLERLHIPRCLVPKDFGTVTVRELHHFSDASTCRYGQCSDLRLINDERIFCILVMGKSRATLTSVKISNLLKREMKHKNLKEFFWTDSEIVLGYIRNDARRFHVFVSNRVQQIKNSSLVDQWQYIPGQQNLADHASRGLYPEDLINSEWLSGPAFLCEREIHIVQPQNFGVAVDDPEVKKVVVNAAKTKVEKTVLERLECFSEWTRVVTAVTAFKWVVSRKRKDQMSVSDRQQGEMTVLKLIQAEAFPEEIKTLKQEGVLQKGSKLYKLDPFLDDGVLRVGGRLGQSSLDWGVKHPVVLPGSGHMVGLITRYSHWNVAHQGRGFTINELRARGFWVLGCSRAVSSYIFKCVTCRKLRGMSQTQKMAELPQVRVVPTAPFTYCRMDCFGPFLVKVGRREQKRYGLLFTCMASRAIHIETLDDLSTDAFLNALKCFIAIKGPVRVLRCDQGSNFVGACNELRKSLQEIKDDRIKDYLQKHLCDFVFNPPHYSHMGGVWERHIRIIRSILKAMLNQHGSRMDTSTLKSFLYETMAIVNSRLLAPDSLHEGPVPITPNHLLTFFLLLESFLKKMFKPEDFVRGQCTRARVIGAAPDSDGLVRKVRLLLGNSNLSKQGKRLVKPSILERPIHKLTLLLENEQEW